jgi:hypothetical protein
MDLATGDVGQVGLEQGVGRTRRQGVNLGIAAGQQRLPENSSRRYRPLAVVGSDIDPGHPGIGIAQQKPGTRESLPIIVSHETDHHVAARRLDSRAHLPSGPRLVGKLRQPFVGLDRCPNPVPGQDHGELELVSRGPGCRGHHSAGNKCGREGRNTDATGPKFQQPAHGEAKPQVE